MNNRKNIKQTQSDRLKQKITDMCSKSVCEFDHYDNESRLVKMEEALHKGTYIIASTTSKIQSSKSPDTK